MDKEEFNEYWKSEYPEAYPINHEFRLIYEDRWFRIHSLSKLKRYAEADTEYQIMINRQNQLINDLIGEKNKIIVSFGVYTNDISNDNYKELTDFGEFKKVQTIDLHKIRPKEYEDQEYYEIYIKDDYWKDETKNEILKAIADDKIKAMFICPSRHCIIAPYDGGVDIIVDSSKNEMN